MRLYVNPNEIDPLKLALEEAITEHNEPRLVEHLCALLERVNLCDLLQKNVKRTNKYGEGVLTILDEKIKEQFTYHDDDPIE